MLSMSCLFTILFTKSIIIIIQTKYTTVNKHTQVMMHIIRCLHYESISLHYRTLYIRVLSLQLILETRLIENISRYTWYVRPRLVDVPAGNTARTTSFVVTPVCPPVYSSLCLLDSRDVYMPYIHASILSCFHKRYTVYINHFSNSVRLTGSYLVLPGISIVWSPSYAGRVTFCDDTHAPGVCIYSHVTGDFRHTRPNICKQNTQ